MKYMFRCWMIKKNLLEYCHNELSEKKADKIKKHMSICLKCREEYERTQNLLRILSNKEIKKPSADFWDEYKTDLMEKWKDLKQKRLFSKEFGPGYIPNTAFDTEISLQFKLAATIFILVVAVITTGIFVNKKELSPGQMLSEYIILEDLEENITLIENDNKAVELLVKDIEFAEQTDLEVLIKQSLILT